MGIQINGQTDTISATDGGFTIDGASGNLIGNLTGNVTGNLTGTASTATAAATAYGLSGSPTLSGITSVSTTNLTVNGNAYPTAGPLSNRNRIINGDMRIDQRNNGSSVTITSSGYTLDRWRAGTTDSSKFSVQQSTTAPAGFTNSLLFTSLSADSGSSGDQYGISQRIEGNNVADLAWGTSDAKDVTLSFWVRSSLTGTFGGSLRNNSVNRSYPFTYTISSANTWEYKTITIPGDTSGTWDTSTNIGILLNFGLGEGSTVSGTAGAWAGANYTGATGAVQVTATNAATWYITGVQLEVGTVATPFEHRSYGDELARCQRYFQILATGGEAGVGNGWVSASTEAHVYRSLVTEMRSTPTVYDQTSGAVRFRLNSAAIDINTGNGASLNGTISNTSFIMFVFSGFSGLTNGQGCLVRKQGSTAILGVSAEL